MNWRNAAYTAISVLLLTACDPSQTRDNFPDSHDTEDQQSPTALTTPTAIHSHRIRSLFLDSRECRPAIGDALEDDGLRLSTPGESVDVILVIELDHKAGWLREVPLIGTHLGGIVTRAGYKATVIGKGGQVLLSLHGEERAITGLEMCQDIGDNLAARLTRRQEED